MPDETARLKGNPTTLEGLKLELEDGDVDLGAFAATTRVLFVFAPDCALCMRAAPELKRLASNRPAMVKFFGIMLNPAAALDLPAFVNNVGDLGFPLGYCHPGHFNVALGIPKGRWVLFPTLILLGADDRCHRFLTPDGEEAENNCRILEAAIEKLLGATSGG